MADLQQRQLLACSISWQERVNEESRYEYYYLDIAELSPSMEIILYITEIWMRMTTRLKWICWESIVYSRVMNLRILSLKNCSNYRNKVGSWLE